MSKQIISLPQFIQAVQNEFWYCNPQLYAEYAHWLGCRISQVQNEELKETDFIREWKDRLPSLSS